jgi:hypothetical protein
LKDHPSELLSEPSEEIIYSLCTHTMVAEYLKTVSDTEKRIVELEASTEGWKKVKETVCET